MISGTDYIEEYSRFKKNKRSDWCLEHNRTASCLLQKPKRELNNNNNNNKLHTIRISTLSKDNTRKYKELIVISNNFYVFPRCNVMNHNNVRKSQFLRRILDKVNFNNRARLQCRYIAEGAVVAGCAGTASREGAPLFVKDTLWLPCWLVAA